MRARFLGCIVLVCLCVLSGFTPEEPRLQAFVDSDYDGIDDNLKASLAAQFRPTIWYAYNDNCLNPYPRKAVYRVRHPSVWGARNFNFILINYVLLYNEDCAGNGHQGDNEPFEVWLQWNGSGWQFVGVTATAHYDTMFERRTMSYTNTIWVGNSKHGNYADSGQCGVWGSSADECHSDFTTSHQLYNAGEPYAWLLQGLSAVYGPWSSEGVWYDYDDKFFGAGSIRRQLSHNRFISVIRPPAYWPCANQCNAEQSSCINSQPPDSQHVLPGLRRM